MHLSTTMEVELLHTIFLLFKVLLNHIKCKLNVESGRKVLEFEPEPLNMLWNIFMKYANSYTKG